MAAYVVERADSALFVAHDDHTGIGKVANKVVARLGNLVRAPRTQPHVEMDSFHFALEPIAVRVVTLGQSADVGDCGFSAAVRIGAGHYRASTKIGGSGARVIG